jgi:signal transduction histidine kinase
MVLEFLDTGCGMENEQLKMIFDPFYTTKDVGEGTGLGLFVTYSIIERMGGKISVESRKGQGSRFTVTLPVTPCNNQPGIGNADD